MATLLVVESSPRKDRSASIAVAGEFIAAYRESHPGDDVEVWDLWKSELPPFDGDVLNAKYAILHGQEHTESQRAAWGRVVKTFERFNAADKYLFSLPMWNFGIPYRLKHFIDVITQPGLSFSYSPEQGYRGLVTGKPVAVVYARGGEYSSSPGAQAMDFQKPYLEALLTFIGFTAIETILVEPTLAAPAEAAGAKERAVEQARRAAAAF